MAAKKGKKKIKVHDLKPRKDAKGGVQPNIAFSGPGGLGPGGNPPKGNPPAGPLGPGGAGSN